MRRIATESGVSPGSYFEGEALARELYPSIHPARPRLDDVVRASRGTPSWALGERLPRLAPAPK